MPRQPTDIFYRDDGIALALQGGLARRPRGSGTGACADKGTIIPHEPVDTFWKKYLL